MKNEEKQSIGLIVDDVCSLPENIINDFQIEVVKVKLFFPEWEKFPEKNLYQLMKETKAHPKTSAPSPGDYLKAYKKVLNKFEKVLVITVSSKLSATYNSAFEARQLMPDPSRVFLFDSLLAAVPQGLLTIKATRLIKEGKKIEEIKKSLDNLKEKAKLMVFIPTTYWIEKIGRMTHFQATAFKILKGFGVQPIIGIKKGKVGLTGFNFWTKNILKAVFNQLKNKRRKAEIEVGINYTDNIDLAYKLKEKLEKELKVKVDFVSMTPPIIGANTGPGTLLVGYISK